MRDLVIASNNVKKRREIESFLAGSGIILRSPAQTSHVDVCEDGHTFAENAYKKAFAFAKANACLALADDSGLCVDALNAAPGVYSARFAGEDADDAANNALLLQRLQGESQRNAHFVCALCLCDADGHRLIEVEGYCEGHILHALDGQQGFGYDPLFFSHDLGKSFACASADEKASVSHRGHALRQLEQQLKMSPLWK